MRLFLFAAVVALSFIASATAVVYSEYGLSNFNCTHVSKLAGVDNTYGGKINSAETLLAGPNEDLFYSVSAGSATIANWLNVDSEAGYQIDGDDITEWNDHHWVFVTVSEDGYYALGVADDEPIDVNGEVPNPPYIFTHLVPIAPSGVDGTRNSIALSIPINMNPAEPVFMFTGHNELGFFSYNNLGTPQFYLVNLLDGECTIVPSFAVIEENICNVDGLITYGVLEKTADSYTVLCLATDGLVRLDSLGQIDDYVWGPWETNMDMHDVSADYFHPNNGTWYAKTDSYTTGIWFGDVNYPESSQTVFSCQATYNLVEEQGDGDGGDGDGDGDGGAASTLSSFIQELF